MGKFAAYWLPVLFLVAPAFGRAAEENLWPLRTTETAANGEIVRQSTLGPLFFEQKNADNQVSGFRPFYFHRTWQNERREQSALLYPILKWERRGSELSWSVFALINSDRRPSGAEAADPPAPADWNSFDFWPLYFSRDTGKAETSYHALFPLCGTIKDRLGSDRIDFVLAPLYVRTQTGGHSAVCAPWPLIKVVKGDESGFQFWPLFGWREKPGVFSERFWLWPLVHDRKRTVDEGTDRYRAFLPFYATRTAPHLRDESFLLPFFGYTHRTQPEGRETRYFWPLFVQARGAGGRLTNRWAPFYTHSIRSGTEKTWVLWPLYRNERYLESGLNQNKVQFAFFVYWHLEQHDPLRPKAPPASKTHLWPLFSTWDNGAGRRQFQLLSPFEVFFQHNDTVRTLWSPLTAVYRFDRRSAEEARASFLFDAVTYRRRDRDWRVAVGPLFSLRNSSGRRGFSLLGGLAALDSSATDSRWRFLWLRSASAPKGTRLASTQP